jgi:thiosulfate/3-mercaptopyruvate sulfurtransferase
MGALGIGDRSRVVLYDSFMSIWAARVWWMLRWVGFDQAAILDGGLTAWMAENRTLSTEQVAVSENRLTPKPRPDLIADREEVIAALDQASVRLIDTLPPEHYRGEQSPYGRPGHIPGASNVFAGDLLDATGRYKPPSELKALHEGDKEARTITYCGGGIMASSNAFVLNRLGFRDVAVYAASLQEWAADPNNPLDVGET